jgi:phage portal protein BeeE
MGIFSRKVETAHFASAPVKAAAGSAYVNNFLYYQTGSDEIRALSVPTVSRSRDLIAGLIGSLELKHYQKVWNSVDEEYTEVYLPLEPWMERPDPKVTRSFFYVNIFSDLFFYGVAYAYITRRYAPQGAGQQGFPAAFTWLPAANVTSVKQSGIPQYYGPSDELEFNGQALDVNNVVQFISPIEGILKIGARAINTSIYLDQAADRYAQLETVPGYLQQVDGEDLSGEDLGSLASAWANARKQNAIGALSRQVEFREYRQNPQDVISDQRKYQALEMARLCNIPAYLVSAPTEGASMTYQNAQQARQDLYLFGARIYLDVIEQTLSADNILPRGRYVEFNMEDYAAEVAEDTPSRSNEMEDA